MTNAERAEHVHQCIMHYEQITQSERENSLADFLASAMHWADEQGVDFADKLRLARDHYDAEVEEERQQRAALLNFTIVYTDLSGDVHTYNLEASNHSEAKTKFLDEFPDGVNSVDYVIPGNDDSIRAIQIYVKAIEDASVANLTRTP